MWLGKQELKKSLDSAGGGGRHCNATGSIGPQQRHHSHDDGHCDSSSANDADVDNDKDDGGKQQRKQMQQQHSSAAIKTRALADGVIV